MKMKKLLLSCGLVAFSGAMLATSTFAWFSMNKEVTVKGLEVKASTAGSLVIDKVDNLINKTNIQITESATNKVLLPTKYVSGGEYDLQYNTNPADVNPNTGLAKTDATLTFANIETDEKFSEHTYFVDFDYYVAGQGAAMTSHDLYISLANIQISSAGTKGTDFQTEIGNAFSVLVYAGTGTTLTYQGLLDLADHDADHKFTGEAVKYACGTIPQAAAVNNIHIKLRVFLDGSKMENDTQTWVRNVNSVVANDCVFEAKFEAKESA